MIICDRCKQEADKKIVCIAAVIEPCRIDPAMFERNLREELYSTPCDLCDKCLEKLRNTISEFFAVSDPKPMYKRM